MADPTQLIPDPQVRAARAAAKVRLLLRFLREECWTTTEIAARVLGVQYPAAHRTLRQMQRDDYLKSETLAVPTHHAPPEGGPGGLRLRVRPQVLWGITPHGLAFAWDLDEVMQERAAFELGKTNPAYVEHAVTVQRLRLAAAEAGWGGWTAGRLLTKQGLLKVPDAEGRDPTGACVAVEFERELKTPKRYQAIIGTYLMALKHGRWQRVEYVCPTADMAARLQRAFYSLSEITHQGSRAVLHPELHLAGRFTFTGLDAWPVVRKG